MAPPKGTFPGKPWRDGVGRKFAKEEVELALRKGNGIRNRAAAILGCDPMTIGNYIKRYPELAEVKKEVDFELVNLAKTALQKRLIDTIEGNTKYPADGLIKFVLRCKDNWVQKQAVEVTGADGKDLFANLSVGQVALLEANGFEACEMFELFVQEYCERMKSEGKVRHDGGGK